jgi:predicted flap endonuclease-1-like 5' DNA nuclease
MDIWPLCNFNGIGSALWLLLPLLLGLLTGFAIWAGRKTTDLAYAAPAAPQPVAAPEPVAFKAPDPEPVAAPVAAPVAVAEPEVSTGAGLGVAAGAAGLTAIGVAAATTDPDDLLVIKGIGPKLNGMLNGMGITTFAQIANWNRDDVAKVDANLGEFQGRVDREEWIPQAKLLAAGNNTEWERIYGAGAVAAGAAAVVATKAKKAAAPKMTAIGIPAAVGDPDDLLQIKGVGPKLNELLISLGIRRFDQIAAWGRSEVEKVDGHLGNFKGRIDRDNWVDQSGLLAKGMIAEFESKYGKLDSENK